MSFWSIGPIRGEFQPEDFDEIQEANWETDDLSFGDVSVVEFKSWGRRKVNFSFVVDNLNRNDFPSDAFDTDGRKATNTGAVANGVDFSDPEDVFAALVEMSRPAGGGEPQPININLPGWGGSNVPIGTAVKIKDAKGKERSALAGVGTRGAGPNVPTQAVITKVSINRTHIKGNPPRAVRATITVALEEASGLVFSVNGPSGSK